MKYILSRFNHDIEWLKHYTDDYVLYDRSEQLYIKAKNLIATPNIGSDIYDKFTYIIDNYDNLPDVAVYTKANLFKYITKEEWDLICNNTTFTPILTQNHKEQEIDLETNRQFVINMIETSDLDEESKEIWYRLNQVNKDKVGEKKKFAMYQHEMYYELNICHYLKLLQGHEKEDTRLVKELMQLLGIYDLEYIPFAPGSNYILPKENILKHPKELYQRLKDYLANGILMQDSKYPREAMIIERGLYTLWK